MHATFEPSQELGPPPHEIADVLERPMGNAGICLNCSMTRFLPPTLWME